MQPQEYFIRNPQELEDLLLDLRRLILDCKDFQVKDNGKIGLSSGVIVSDLESSMTQSLD